MTTIPELPERPEGLLHATEELERAHTLLYALIRLGEALQEPDAGSVCAVTHHVMQHVEAAARIVDEVRGAPPDPRFAA